MTSTPDMREPRFTLLTIVEGAIFGTIGSLLALVPVMGRQFDGQFALEKAVDGATTGAPVLFVAWLSGILIFGGTVWRMLQSAGYSGYASASSLGFFSGFALFIVFSIAQGVMPYQGDVFVNCDENMMRCQSPHELTLKDWPSLIVNGFMFGLLCAAVGLYMRFRAR
jgi:hypothetical protein